MFPLYEEYTPPCVLGLSGGFHDAGATLISNQGDILFAGHAERYSGLKNDPDINQELINDALSYGDPQMLAWYENPWLKKTRQIYSGEWRKIFSPSPTKYAKQFGLTQYMEYHRHHKSHAAAGFQTSPFENAKVVVVDAIGEWDTISIWDASYDIYGFAKYKLLFRQKYPHSIGLFYSAITDYVGLKPMEDEYILMGMAAYGGIYETAYKKCLEMISSVNQQTFKDNLHAGIPENIFPEGLDKFDIAAGAQIVTEQLLENLFRRHVKFTDNVVFMGGVALNCVANSKLRPYYNGWWIMPNPGDCGSSLGAAALSYGKKLNWQGPYLGHDMGGPYPVDAVIGELQENKIVGVATGRAEFGPRALGTRSLLADPRGTDIKDRVNEIKRRQKFRPFAPMVLEEHANKLFFMCKDEPYMQGVYKCKYPETYPAIVHKDGTSRVQTVGRNDHSGVRELLEKWYVLTDCPMLLNTSLNIKGEPMVNNRLDADRFEKRYGVKVCS